MKLTLKNKLIVGSFSLSLFLIIVGLSIAYVKLSNLQNLLIIHYDSYNGIDFLGNRNYVYFILLIGLGLGLVNLILVDFFYYREKFLAYLLAFSNILVSLLILLSAIAIIMIN